MVWSLTNYLLAQRTFQWYSLAFDLYFYLSKVMIIETGEAVQWFTIPFTLAEDLGLILVPTWRHSRINNFSHQGSDSLVQPLQVLNKGGVHMHTQKKHPDTYTFFLNFCHFRIMILLVYIQERVQNKPKTSHLTLGRNVLNFLSIIVHIYRAGIELNHCEENACLYAYKPWVHVSIR